MDGYKPDGKRKRKSFYGKTQKEAKAKADEITERLLVKEETLSDRLRDVLFQILRAIRGE